MTTSTFNNTKKSKLLLVSWILGAIYIAYILYYMFSSFSNATGDAQVGAGLGIAIITPHVIAAGIAVLLNVLGWSMNKRGFALSGAILYAVSIVLFPLYFMFVIIQMILSFVGYAKMKKA